MLQRGGCVLLNGVNKHLIFDVHKESLECHFRFTTKFSFEKHGLFKRNLFPCTEMICSHQFDIN